jgi:hypothetical protein
MKQDRQNDVSWDAVLYLGGSRLQANLVQHAVIFLYGNHTEGLDKVTAQATGEGVPKELFMNTITAWIEDATVVDNSLLSIQASKTLTEASENLLPSQAADLRRGAAERLQQFFSSRGTPATWSVNSITLPMALNVSNPLEVTLHQHDVSPDKDKELLPLRPLRDGNANVSCDGIDRDSERAPAVYSASFTLLVGRNVSVSRNKGFPHVLRHGAGWLVHLQTIALRDNNVSRSLVEVIYSDTVIKDLTVEDNAAYKQLVMVDSAQLALLQVSKIPSII